MTDNNDNDMTNRLSNYRNLVSSFSTSLKDFQSSSSKFRILKTVYPSNPTQPQEPSTPTASDSPKTLFVLDSSFNPPSIAHQYLAESALKISKNNALSSQFPKPHRLLLLFATMNADKAPSAAAFEQRLTLMSIFAGDLLKSLQSKADEYSIVPVDIGVTSVPYYTDKSAAIENEGKQFYPNQPKHVHLIGFDSLTRLFAAKYYPKFDPPFSALDPFFRAGHRLRVTLRPDDSYGTVAEQKAFLQSLADGEWEDKGGKTEWAEQIELVEPSPKAGVSSTKIRRAAKGREWEELRALTTEGVCAWVKGEGLYEDDAEGAKMA